MKSIESIINENSFFNEILVNKLISTHKALSELKWVANILPNSSILVNTLSLQEAKSSSEIENIITTQDDLFKSDHDKKNFSSIEAKEVYSYSEALYTWWKAVIEKKVILINDLVKVQTIITNNDAWIRKWWDVKVVNASTWEVVYTPPQDPQAINKYLNELEKFVNNNDDWIDSLIKVAIIHHQFESIHPFFDWNWRTWRILNILYLVLAWELDLPILYLSRYINRNKQEYYRYLQWVRTNWDWISRVMFMLNWIEETSRLTITIINQTKDLMMKQKHMIRSSYPKLYSQDLINNIFKHPYTKIEFLIRDLWCSRFSAWRILNTLCSLWILIKKRIWKENYYINSELFELLQNVGYINMK